MSHISQITDKYNLHDYYNAYCNLSKKINVKKLLEIGIGGYQSTRMGGESLFSWAELFPNAQLVALDYYDKSDIDKPIDCQIYKGSQDDPDVLKKIVDDHGFFDLIVDDGSHISRHIIYTFEFLFPYLSDGGVYIIEDVQTSYWKKFEGGLDNPDSSMNYFKSLLDSINSQEILVEYPLFAAHKFAAQVKSIRFEHNLIFIEKGENTYPSNFNFNIEHHEVKKKIHELEIAVSDEPYNQTLVVSLCRLLLSGSEYQRVIELCNVYFDSNKECLNIYLLKAKAMKGVGLTHDLKIFLELCLKQFPEEILFLKMALPLTDKENKAPLLKTIARHVNSDDEDIFNYLIHLTESEQWDELEFELSTICSSRASFVYFDFFKAVITFDNALIESEIERAFDLNNDNEKIVLLYFKILNSQKLFNKIIQIFNQLSSQQQDNRMLSVQYVNACISAKRYGDAESAIHKRLMTESTYHFWDLLSKSKELQGDIKQAAAFAYQAVNCNPTHKGLINRLSKFEGVMTIKR
jgi:hypothetical protein